MTATYEIQTDGGEWSDYDGYSDVVTVELLAELFAHGVTFAALDINIAGSYHNVKIKINRNV